MVGGLYAAGVPLDQIAALAISLGQRPIRALGLDLAGLGGACFGRPLLGLFSGRPLLNRFRAATRDAALKDLDLPFGCTVYDLTRHELRLYASRPADGVRTDGSLAELLRAAASFPGLLQPVREPDGTLLIDGGVADDLPIRLCRQLGADAVIAVALGPQRLPEHPGALDVAATAVLATTSHLAQAMHRPELWLRPDLTGLRVFHPDVRALMERGVGAVGASLVDIEALVSAIARSAQSDP